MNAVRAVAIVLGLAAAALGALVLHDRHARQPLIHASTDFSTFYCAGAVVRAHADPYRVEPLRTCERGIGELANEPAWYVVPAPFPGYALALFAGLSLLPVYAAHLLWLYALFVAVGATAWALGRVTGFSPWLIGLLIATPLGFYDVGFGEPTPLFAALLALAAERAQRGAWRSCGALCGLAMLEPHLGLPAFVAIVLFAPRARAALLVTVAALAIVSVGAIGVRENVEYFAVALPAHAASEATLFAQFSLTHLLVSLGVPVRAALLAGSVSSVLAVIAGVWAGRRVERSQDMPAALVLVPAAVGMIGGTFLHENQVVTAVGAALLLARARSLPPPLAVAPLALFAVFWVADASWKPMLAATIASAAAGFVLVATALEGRPARLRVAGAYALACAVAFVALQRLPHPEFGGRIDAPAPRVADDAEASAIWAYRNSVPPASLANPRFEAEKLPYVLALGLTGACAVAMRRGRRRRGAGEIGAGIQTVPA